MAKTFLKIPEHLENEPKLIVNHINGIPGDDWLDNLEWCTYSHNTKHAYDNDLHSEKVRPVCVWDFRNDREYKFPTIQAASDYTGIVYGTLSGRYHKRASVRFGDFAVKPDDGTPWSTHFLRTAKNVRNVVARNVFTKVVYVFSTQSDCARHIGVTQGAVFNMIKRGSRRPIRGYVVQHLPMAFDWPEYSEFQLDIIRDNEQPTSGFIVTDTSTQEKDYFTTWKSLMARFLMTRAALIKRIEREQLIENRYQITKITIDS